MDLILQIWGGLFYLTNKIFFALAEGKGEIKKRNFKIAGWVIYILGVPAWVIILIMKHNWIAASIEFGGVPSMVLGLYTVYKRENKPLRNLDLFASFFTYFFIVAGTLYSVYENLGITSISQVLEIGVMIGFLLGSYKLAKNNISGWLFFMLMNGSMGTLMIMQNKPILACQQAVSFIFVFYGFITALRTNPEISESRIC